MTRHDAHVQVTLTDRQCLTLLKLINSRIHVEQRARGRASRITARKAVLAKGGVDVSQQYLDRLTALRELFIKASGIDRTRLHAELQHEH